MEKIWKHARRRIIHLYGGKQRRTGFPANEITLSSWANMHAKSIIDKQPRATSKQKAYLHTNDFVSQALPIGNIRPPIIRMRESVRARAAHTEESEAVLDAIGLDIRVTMGLSHSDIA